MALAPAVAAAAAGGLGDGWEKNITKNVDLIQIQFKFVNS